MSTRTRTAPGSSVSGAGSGVTRMRIQRRYPGGREMTSTRWPPGARGEGAKEAPVLGAVGDIVAGGAQRGEVRPRSRGRRRRHGLRAARRDRPRRSTWTCVPPRCTQRAARGAATQGARPLRIPAARRTRRARPRRTGGSRARRAGCVTGAPGSRRGCASARRYDVRSEASSRAVPRGRRRPRAGSPARARPSIGTAVAGDDVVGLLDERAQALERREVRAARATAR